jgi:4-diphosphocytidyl-2-C-methyl-D-erythritol kinase
LGGGSIDAAAALRALNQLWNCGLSTSELEQLGCELGADVPACVRARPVQIAGIGERLIDVPQPSTERWYVLAHTGKPLPTAQVFGELQAQEWTGRQEEMVEGERPLLPTRNDLEVSAMRLQPEITDLLADLRAESGCLVARMSGSGAACYGLFDRGAPGQSAAATAVASLSRRGWWAVATRLKGQ